MIAAESSGSKPRGLAVLGPGDVHVWHLTVDEDAPFDSAGNAAPLSPDEREREARLVFEKDRRLFRSAHLMVRSVLSQYADVSPDEWQFDGDPNGKPRIRGPLATPQPLRFNLSHTRGLAAVAVTLEDEIGVDVERLDPPKDPDLARVCFTTAERGWLGDPAEPSRFFELWTLKEAYLKARGEGLSLPLQSFSVHTSGPHAASISFDAEPGSPRIDDDPRAWQFHRCRITPQHVLAVALRRPSSRPMQVTLREWRPQSR